MSDVLAWTEDGQCRVFSGAVGRGGGGGGGRGAGQGQATGDLYLGFPRSKNTYVSSAETVTENTNMTSKHTYTKLCFQLFVLWAAWIFGVWLKGKRMKMTCPPNRIRKFFFSRFCSHFTFFNMISWVHNYISVNWLQILKHTVPTIALRLQLLKKLGTWSPVFRMCNYTFFINAKKN